MVFKMTKQQQALTFYTLSGLFGVTLWFSFKDLIQEMWSTKIAVFVGFTGLVLLFHYGRFLNDTVAAARLKPTKGIHHLIYPLSLIGGAAILLFFV